ncbi:MAG: hypothetical protein M1823_001027 [Watsoniomyces obsoletus]|nr:MAG: hypothetical protein M1823_001027 [Watsoniomyces obsoletus]
MEKFSQFRDRGSGIAPFLPVPRQSSSAYLPVLVFIFVLRCPIFIAVTVGYFLVLQWLPVGSLARKALLWMILGVPGIWWVDLRIDGVKRGSLAKHHALRLPQPSDIIASSFTSPIDALYLAAIFDPIFTASYPSTRQVRRITLLGAILRAFRSPRAHPPPGAKLVDLRTLIEAHPDRVVAVFPETTTTNGQGILTLSPSLLSAPPNAKIFPINLRYTPADITTPLPGTYFTFLWNLLSEPTHCIQVRIAECVYHSSRHPTPLTGPGKSFASNLLETLQTDELATSSSTDTLTSTDEPRAGHEQSAEERKVLDRVSEALARLGRAKRVALGPRDKIVFVESWKRRHRI